ncbi:hypothetical protein VNO77_23469 [Canavalia gladiata]|uniref:Uncharacterized protein n=1 Tax=Canavalia gladiata TaxID=3824 RepID=A0AAN9QBW1_CANGL
MHTQSMIKSYEFVVKISCIYVSSAHQISCTILTNARCSTRNANTASTGLILTKHMQFHGEIDSWILAHCSDLYSHNRNLGTDLILLEVRSQSEKEFIYLNVKDKGTSAATLGGAPQDPPRQATYSERGFVLPPNSKDAPRAFI